MRCPLISWREPKMKTGKGIGESLGKNKSKVAVRLEYDILQSTAKHEANTRLSRRNFELL